MGIQSEHARQETFETAASESGTFIVGACEARRVQSRNPLMRIKSIHFNAKAREA